MRISFAAQSPAYRGSRRESFAAAGPNALSKSVVAHQIGEHRVGGLVVRELFWGLRR
jgi:hypothetical protein